MMPTNRKDAVIKVDKTQLALLEKLSNAVSVSGREDEVRQIVIDAVKSRVDEYKIDALGNVLAVKHAADPKALRVLFAAHMDEIGFMLVEDEGEGLFAFEPVGGMDERQLAAKSLLVGKDHLPGVIGSKPIHLEKPADRRQTISMSNMRIDVSPAAGGKLEIGEFAAFATRFQRSGDSLFGKALDDRLGVASLIELIQNCPKNLEVLFAFTVQEELILRGARVAAFDFQPDMAFIVDATPAIDLPRWDGTENTQYNCRLGYGPAIYVSDAGTISDPRLIHFLLKLAEENHIPCQMRQPGGGGTDAGAIHVSRSGVPSVSVSIPIRYPHSPISLAKIKDWEYTMTLLDLAMNQIDRSILAAER